MNDNRFSELWVSSSPHAHSGESVRSIMVTVILALCPIVCASVFYFGWDAVRLYGVCIGTCVLAEYVVRRLMKRDPGIDDGSAVITGLLLACNLPPTLPTWMAALGSGVSIIVAKQIYGGIGYNLFNPALIGRTFLLLSFPVAMTTWILPHGGHLEYDAITTATPLGAWKTAWVQGAAPQGYFQQYSLLDLFVGNRAGCIGETSVIAIICGALILFWRRCITWHVPVSYIGSVLFFSIVMHRINPEQTLPPLYHLLSGGLMIGAFFMATDMVTIPPTPTGRILFGLGCGIITMVIRYWGGYPEGVSFSILIMNSMTPLLTIVTRPRVYGHRRITPVENVT